MDQHVVTDWKAYFASLPEGRPTNRPNITPMFEGEPRPRVHFVSGLDIKVVECEMENLFETAKEVYEANEGPEMWIFSHIGGPPWHVDARPKEKKVNRK